MNIQKIHIGSWFQRTPLHLSETYDFLRGEKSPLNLDNNKLQKLLKNLELEDIELIPAELDYISAIAQRGIKVKLYEDGLIRLENDHRELSKDIEELKDYYEKKLSPALNYVFSLGAPIPKELANIKTIYPYFVVIKKATPEEVYKLIKGFGQQKHFEVRQ